MRRNVAWLIAGLLLTGCAGNAGIQEFRTYHTAFAEANRSSQTLLDELAVAERRAKLNELARIEHREVPIFDPNNARYYSSLGDPPATLVFRSTLSSLSSYNETLLSYAEGRSLDSLKGSASMLGADARDMVAGLSGATNLVKDFGQEIATLVPAAGTLVAVAEAALDAGSRDAFRTAFLKEYDTVHAVFVVLHNSGGTIFAFLTKPLVEERFDAIGSPDRIASIDRRVDGRRILVADWVAMVDDTRDALAKVKAAIERPRGVADVASDLATTMNGLRSRSEALRRRYAELSSGAAR